MTESGTVLPWAPVLRGRPVLFTGASGFLGRHLCRRLARLGADIHALTRPETTSQPDLPGVTWHPLDLRALDDPAPLRELVARVRPVVVFHLASEVEGRRDDDLALPMLDANARAAVAVMTAAGESPGCRVVLAGSVEEPRGEEPPCSPYAAAKAAATGYARMFHAQWGLPVTVLRIAMVYGPDQPDTRKLVPYVTRSLLDGTTPAISSGTRRVDWVHVDDVVEAFVAATRSPEAPGAVVDVGSGEAVTIAEVVRELARLAGYGGDLGFGALADRADDGARIADPEPAARLLGWRVATPLSEGLAATVAWHREAAAAACA